MAINRFEASGILVSGSGAAGNRVEGNFIGTKTDGTGDLGNSEYGVQIPGAPNNTVGGTTGGARNIISNNNLEGVLISGSAVGNNATGNKVQGHRITGNRREVEIFGLPNNANNLIVGTVSGAGNFISGNEGNGVRISESGTGNSILSNQIFGNGRLGIDLGGGSQDSFGVTPNDEDDPDTGPNSLQNLPLITSATRFSTGGTTITGTLNSTPSQNFLIQCFLADNDPSDHGEGSVLVGQAATATNANGDSPPFSCSSTIPQPGQRVTMMATRLNTSTTPATHIDTSEFAPNFVVIPGP